MPLYEYACTNCGRHIERIQKFSDPPLTTCEFCNGSLKRLLAAPAIQFKGSGWYVTDYARKSSVSASNSSAETSPSSNSDKSDKKEKATTTTSSEPAKSAPSKS